MAFVRRGIGDSNSVINSGRRSTGSSGFVRWFAIPIAMVAIAAWGMATLAGLHSAASLAYSGSYGPAALPARTQLAGLTPRLHKIAPPAARWKNPPGSLRTRRRPLAS